MTIVWSNRFPGEAGMVLGGRSQEWSKQQKLCGGKTSGSHHEWSTAVVLQSAHAGDTMNQHHLYTASVRSRLVKIQT